MTPEERERTRRYVARLDRQHATLAAQLEDEIGPLRGSTLQQRGDWIASVCRSAWAILRSRGDQGEVVAHPEPPAPDFDEIWRRLMAAHRASRRRARA